MSMKFRFFMILLTLCACSTPPPPVANPSVTTETENTQIDRVAIKKTVYAHRRYIGDCYGKALLTKGNEHLKGTIMVGFEIGPDGKAQSPRVLEDRSSLKNEQLSQCLMAGLVTWDFPVAPTGEDVSVNYPFVFRDNPPSQMQQKLDRFQNLRKQPSSL